MSNQRHSLELPSCNNVLADMIIFYKYYTCGEEVVFRRFSLLSQFMQNFEVSGSRIPICDPLGFLSQTQVNVSHKAESKNNNNFIQTLISKTIILFHLSTPSIFFHIFSTNNVYSPGLAHVKNTSPTFCACMQQSEFGSDFLKKCLKIGSTQF